MSHIVHIKSITEGHKLMGLLPPKHPLVSVIYLKDIIDVDYPDVRFVTDLYMISLKDGAFGSMGYGRNSYDFTDGTVLFTKPNQVMSQKLKFIEPDSEGWIIFFHPDLIRK